MNHITRWKRNTRLMWTVWAIVKVQHTPHVDAMYLKAAHERDKLKAINAELLDACDMVQRAHVGDGISMAEAVDACLLAISKATQ